MEIKDYQTKQIECTNNHNSYLTDKCKYCSSKNLCVDLNSKLFGDLENLDYPRYIWKSLKDIDYKEVKNYL